MFRKSAENINKAIEWRLLAKDSVGVGISYNALGNVYQKWGKNKEAIDYYFKALEYFQKANKLDGVSSCYNNISNTYFNLADAKDTSLLNLSLENVEKALSINLEIGFLYDASNNYSNLANIYSAKAENYRTISLESKNDSLKALNMSIANRYFDKALNYINEALAINEKEGDNRATAASLIGMGAILLNKNDKNTNEDAKKALPLFKKALQYSIELGDQYQSSVCYTYIGMVNITLNRPDEAIKNLDKAKAFASKEGLKSVLSEVYEYYSEAYDSLGMYKKSLEAYRIFHSYYDTITKGESKRIISEMSTKYETDQKDAELELLNTENEKKQLQSERQMLIIYGFIGVFIIVIFFSVIVFKQFRHIRRSNVVLSEQKAQIEEANEELNQQNEEIAAQRDEIKEQKDQIEHIHKEVSDSIHYAERIQKAILPKLEDIDEKITDRFILFKPKDIVSGDFYWQKHLKHLNLFVATAADCTGHGVPGAFMSMLGVAFLNEIVNKASITNTGQVLDNLRRSVISSLHQTGKEGEAQDGMDIALVALNYKTGILQFSGANNPLYVIRTKDKPALEADKIEEGEHHTLYEIKADKMPIGIYKKELTDFKTNEIQLEKGDAVYMFSDGYADQFGGPKGKKFKYKPFKRLLLENFDLPMQEQSDILNRHFEDWRGELEQIDDVIVMGIKL